MNTKTVKINGMQCNHCKMRIENVLNSMDEVSSVTVSLEYKSAVIKLNSELDDAKIKEAIEDIGFEVIEIK